MINIIPTGLSDDFASAKHCIPGLHDIFGKADTHMFCEERMLTKFIYIRQNDKTRSMIISEAVGYTETKRKF